MTLAHVGFLADSTGALTNGYDVLLDREPRATDPSIQNDPDKNPRWVPPGSHTEHSSDDAFALEWYGEKSTERLYAILDGPFLLLRDGQVIHNILIARGSWDASRIGTTSTLLDCHCSVCSASAPVDRVRATMDEWAQHFDETLNALKRSAA